MIRVGDVVQPRGSQRRFIVDEHDIEQGVWLLVSEEGHQRVRVSDAVARTIVPLDDEYRREVMSVPVDAPPFDSTRRPKNY